MLLCFVNGSGGWVNNGLCCCTTAACWFCINAFVGTPKGIVVVLDPAAAVNCAIVGAFNGDIGNNAAADGEIIWIAGWIPDGCVNNNCCSALIGRVQLNQSLINFTTYLTKKFT